MFVVLKKSRLIIIAVALAVIILCVTLGVCFGGSATSAVGKEQRKIPVYSVNTEESVVALSFDAAWGSGKRTFAKRRNLMQEQFRYSRRIRGKSYVLFGRFLDRRLSRYGERDS